MVYHYIIIIVKLYVQLPSITLIFTEVALGDDVVSINAVETTSEASTPVCNDSCENVVSAAPSSATWHVATMPHTETSYSQDKAATTTINRTPSPLEASSLQNRPCGWVGCG